MTHHTTVTRHINPDPLMIALTLPFPPSLNNYLRQTGNRRYFTKRAIAFRDHVALICAQERIKPLSGRLSIAYTFHAPNRRRYDIFNMEKAATDALMHAGCFADDEAIDVGTVARGEIVKGGMCKVIILASKGETA